MKGLGTHASNAVQRLRLYSKHCRLLATICFTNQATSTTKPAAIAAQEFQYHGAVSRIWLADTTVLARLTPYAQSSDMLNSRGIQTCSESWPVFWRAVMEGFIEVTRAATVICSHQAKVRQRLVMVTLWAGG